MADTTQKQKPGKGGESDGEGSGDGVLLENVEEFVKNYVQRGGE